MAKQVGGSYKVKNPGILKLYKKLMHLLGDFDKCRVKHVRREENVEADKLSRLTLKNN